MTVRLIEGDCLGVMRTMALVGETVHAVVTDPPYHLTSTVRRAGAENAAPARSGGATGVYARASAGFMGKRWDGGDIAFRPETWRLCFDLLPPGGHLVTFGGTRTFHRMAVAIEDAGFEIRDTLMWLYGTGFPKSHDVSKSIDKMMGAERAVVGRYQPPGMDKPWNLRRAADVRTVEMFTSSRNNLDITCPGSDEAAAWEGWGTALKPAWEPIVLARKPLAGTVAENVLAHRAGALNIDGCRVPTSQSDADYIAARIGGFNNTRSIGGTAAYGGGRTMDRDAAYDARKGRWPANILHDGSVEVEAAFAAFGKGMGGGYHPGFGDSGSASRFFYSAKASRTDREEGCEHLAKAPLRRSAGDENTGGFQSQGTDKAARNNHPTVKPTELMRWLVRLVCPPGGTVLDPFMGSGSTGKACVKEGFGFVGIEADSGYVRVAEARIAHARGANRL